MFFMTYLKREFCFKKKIDMLVPHLKILVMFTTITYAGILGDLVSKKSCGKINILAGGTVSFSLVSPVQLFKCCCL